MRSNDRIEVSATGLDDAGHGICSTDAGSEVRVADLLPGERALVSIDHVSPHQQVAWARVEARRGPAAPERVVPPCPAFGRCGGCAWQHLSYEAQLFHKRERLVRSIDEIDASTKVAAVVPSPREQGYRNKGKYVVGAGPVLGAYAPRTHRVVDTAGCTAVAPVIDRSASLVRSALTSQGLQVYDERARTGHLRYVVIRADAEERALVGLVTTSDVSRDRLDDAAATLVADGSVRGVLWLRNDTTAGAIFDPAQAPVLLAGEPTLAEEIAGVAIDVGITEFLQVNRLQAAHLYDLVARIVGAEVDRRAVDLYCGVGGLSFAMARTGARVLGIEAHPAAVRAAGLAAERAGIADRVSFRVGRADDLPALAADFHADAMVVDPPRKGLSEDVRAAVAASDAGLLVYVSCEPKSLARDLGHLRREAGFRIERILPADLMPGTAQLEAVAVCRR